MENPDNFKRQIDEIKHTMYYGSRDEVTCAIGVLLEIKDTVFSYEGQFSENYKMLKTLLNKMFKTQGLRVKT